MRERINRLARGIIESELPKLFLSPEIVEETLGSDMIYKKELFLSSENNLHVKGLAYSNHSRVRILNNAFGGLRNHISYEVDTSWCENGELIEGSIHLITNSGELEVPFVFRVEMAASIRVLGTLETVEDFALLAQRDMDMALRLMEYHDFTEAPFMQDLHVRTVYEGLKGHGNRQNALEEFFLALKVKEPISLTLSTAGKEYENLSHTVSDSVTLHKNTWGYLYIEVRADGDFIELSKKVITQADFENDRCKFSFKIHPDRMHGGRNCGSIRLLTVHGDTVIPIEATGRVRSNETESEHGISKSGICRYLRLREVYESRNHEKRLLNKLQKELDAIRGACGNSSLLSLLQAEIWIENKRNDQALLCLDACKEQVILEKDRMTTLYCYYQYLQYRVHPNPDKKEELIRLLNRKLDRKKGRFYLQMLMLKLDPEITERPAALYESLKQQYKNGCHSPFLYLETCRLFKKHPELLHVMDPFEIQVLHYGAKLGIIGEDLASQIASLAAGTRFFHRVYYQTLCTLYDRYPGKEMLTAICCLLIKGNVRNESSFFWYQQGIEEEISLTRIYEYYIYSLPEKFKGTIPKQVLLYFSYEHSHLDRNSRAVLYEHILKHTEPDSPIYKAYERSMEQFAMEQLFQSRINSRLAVIYKHIVYRDIIDQHVAEVLPAILKSHRVICKDPAMRYVIVCNEILMREDAYPLQDGAAYVPLFFEHSVLMFQDAYGNRYVEVAHTSEQVMDEPDLEKRCFEVYPEHPMLKMRVCQEIIEKEEITDEELHILEQVLEEQPVKPLYQKKMLSRIISGYRKQVLNEDVSALKQGGNYLLHLDMNKLNRAHRLDVCETLIAQNHIKEAYEMIQKYGQDGMPVKTILKLCSKMIRKNLFEEDETLLHLSSSVFTAGYADHMVLDYLCEHYNGTCEIMYRILAQAVRDHVETYDLEERLLAQMLFCGEHKHLDAVFDCYASRKKMSETLVKAYFVVKCVGYFLQNEIPGDKVFAYLEGAVNSSPEIRKVPEIYLLALTKFYSDLPFLTEEQMVLCKKAMSVLTGQGMLFAYFKKLAAYADVPGDVMNKEIIEYHGDTGSKPILRIRILPDEEEFHEEEMRMVYKGIFVRQKLLFEGEIMEYEVYEEEKGGLAKKQAGEIACTEIPAGDKKNKFSSLNAMALYLNMKDNIRLKEQMVKYVTDDLAVEKLFPLM